MSFLLDSHTLIWAIVYPEKLSVAATKIIEAQESNIYLSSVSLWEISIKFNLKKLHMKGVTPPKLLDEAKKIGIKVVPLLEDESSSFFNLPLQNHRDPFDRMLVWQCIKRNYTIISKDKRLKTYEPIGLLITW
ncbi:MAG: type II toxin-antitoxin system VapC family toxin [Chitinophagales bacterium]|nr:type II toxin-antitoxin system VapC family toxin [Chitinophagales bacterium]